MLDKLHLSHFSALGDSTYVRQTLEFLSSFYYSTQQVSASTIGTVKFRMFNKEYALNKNSLSDLFHFSHGSDIVCETPIVGSKSIEASRLWEQFTGQHATDFERLKSTHIHNPTIQCFHRIMENTLFGRENNGNVNSKELFFIHCAFANIRLNVCPFIFAHMQDVCIGKRGPICIGGLITSIARVLVLEAKLATMNPLPTPSLDILAWRSMRLIKARLDEKYSLMANNQEVKSIILPCPTCTNVQNRANWLYDLSSPAPGHIEPMDIPKNINEGDETNHEYDHMERGSPTPTTLDFANSFTGASSWQEETYPLQQTTAKYDYNAFHNEIEDLRYQI